MFGNILQMFNVIFFKIAAIFASIAVLISPAPALVTPSISGSLFSTPIASQNIAQSPMISTQASAGISVSPSPLLSQSTLAASVPTQPPFAQSAPFPSSNINNINEQLLQLNQLVYLQQQQINQFVQGQSSVTSPISPLKSIPSLVAPISSLMPTLSLTPTPSADTIPPSVTLKESGADHESVFSPTNDNVNLTCFNCIVFQTNEPTTVTIYYYPANHVYSSENVLSIQDTSLSKDHIFIPYDDYALSSTTIAPTFMNLSKNQDYSWKYEIKDAAGNVTTSNWTKVKYYATNPEAPSNITVKSTCWYDRPKITLTWNKVLGVHSYRVYYRPSNNDRPSIINNDISSDGAIVYDPDHFSDSPSSLSLDINSSDIYANTNYYFEIEAWSSEWPGWHGMDNGSGAIAPRNKLSNAIPITTGSCPSNP
jgi:hypothetical protein